MPRVPLTWFVTHKPRRVPLDSVKSGDVGLIDRVPYRGGVFDGGSDERLIRTVSEVSRA